MIQLEIYIDYILEVEEQYNTYEATYLMLLVYMLEDINENGGLFYNNANGIDSWENQLKDSDIINNTYLDTRKICQRLLKDGGESLLQGVTHLVETIYYSGSAVKLSYKIYEEEEDDDDLDEIWSTIKDRSDPVLKNQPKINTFFTNQQ